MKIRFDTRRGIDTKKWWETMVAVTCKPEGETPDQLLESGWLFDSMTDDSWFMSRSVRIDLARWYPSKSALDCVREYEWEAVSELGQKEIDTLREYRRARDIAEYPYDTFQKQGQVKIEKGRSEIADCWYMTVHFGSTSMYPVCAFKKSGTKTSPGKACWTRACQISKDRGSTHLYVYEGYGLGSAYKAGCRGFEWWNGEEWSDDVDEYYRCLENDGVL